jgi:hypothetical protein
MRNISQLEEDFALYLEEIKRCIENKCYWALLHILLIMPDVCSSLEAEMKRGNSDKLYVEWCDEYFPKSSTISGSDRYQMRNTLLHSGSTTAYNRNKDYRTEYEHFSFVNNDERDMKIHGFASANGKILNLQPLVMAEETIKAIYNWFNVLQNDKKKMENVEKNIITLAKKKPKSIHQETVNGDSFIINLTTNSST